MMSIGSSKRYNKLRIGLLSVLAVVVVIATIMIVVVALVHIDEELSNIKELSSYIIQPIRYEEFVDERASDSDLVVMHLSDKSKVLVDVEIAQLVSAGLYRVEKVSKIKKSILTEDIYFEYRLLDENWELLIYLPKLDF